MSDVKLARCRHDPSHLDPKVCPEYEGPVFMATSEEQKRLEVLELPEWYQPMSNSSGSCPWCENMRHWGHADDCPRALVLEILRTALS